MGADRMRPVSVVQVIKAVHPLIGAFDVNAFARTIPATKEMFFGIHQINGITEPASDCCVENRHRHTGSSIGASHHAVQEQILASSEVDVVDAFLVVMHAEILLQNGDQHQHSVVGFRMVELIGLL